MSTALIGVDWGTTSMRLWHLAPSGEIIARRRLDNGILAVEHGRFRETLQAALEVPDKDSLAPGTPILMCGMIGSRQGWIEAPYVACPAAIGTLADHLQAVPDLADATIVPGVMVSADGRRDVMRGEETQILGAGLDRGRRLVVLPGTHCKWVLLEDARILAFATFMTGEAYQALRRHTILARQMPDADPGLDTDVMLRGFEHGVAASLAGGAGLLQSLFQIRVRGLFDELPGAVAPAALSGLLIGAEIAEGLGLCKRWGIAETTPHLVGGDLLLARYRAAFAFAGIATTTAGEDAAAHGLWRIARQRGLVA